MKGIYIVDHVFSYKLGGRNILDGESNALPVFMRGSIEILELFLRV